MFFKLSSLYKYCIRKLKNANVFFTLVFLTLLVLSFNLHRFILFVDIPDTDMLKLKVELALGLAILWGGIIIFNKFKVLTNKVGSIDKSPAPSPLVNFKEPALKNFEYVFNDLKDNEMKMPLGGIYALHQIAQDFEEQRKKVFDKLCLFIKESTKNTVENKNKLGKPSLEVQTSVDLLFKNKGVEIYRDKRGNSFIADLSNSVLQNINLVGAYFENANMINVQLDGGMLEKSSFNHANMEGASLKNAVLTGASLKGVNLFNANLDNAKLISVNFNYARINKASIRGADLYNAMFFKAELIETNWKNSLLHKVNMESADLYKSQMEGVDLYNANLKNTYLYKANLFQANLERTNLENAKLFRVNLKEATLWGTNLTKTNLWGAYFNSADLFRVNLEDAKLRDVVFDNTKLVSSNLKNVKEVTEKQLEKAQTLYNSYGIEEALLKTLISKKPELFEVVF